MVFMLVHKWPIYTVGIIKVKMLIHSSGEKRNSVNHSGFADFLFGWLLARHLCWDGHWRVLHPSVCIWLRRTGQCLINNPD